jgi:DNA-directed RNA polymerase subunit RPC12/RpoP
MRVRKCVVCGMRVIVVVHEEPVRCMECSDIEERRLR